MKQKIWNILLMLVLFGFYVSQVQATFNFFTDGEINDGDVYSGVGIWNDATVDMYGGIVNGDIGVNDQSTFNLWGGSATEIYNGSVVNIYGGEVVFHIRVGDASMVNIYGGSITGDIAVWQSGTLNIYGGNLDLVSPSISFWDPSGLSAVNIYGYGFNYDPDTYVLTGFLADDNPFSIYGIDEEEYSRFNLVPEPPKTYYVDAVDGNDNNDGLSPQTAFATIQKAIDSAFDGDTVLVADGNYTGPGNRDIDFLGKPITVRSESGPENCIVDCNGSEAEPHRGFHFISGEDANSVLDGLTVTNGCAYGGGGIFCKFSDPIIANCMINGNAAKYGGGICCWWDSSPTITNCTITRNSVERGGGGIFYDGCKYGDKLIIANCNIGMNTASAGGGICGMSYKGNIIITNCTITGNSAQLFGGGIDNHSGSKITNCVFSGNSARQGGGIVNHLFARPTLTNCILSINLPQQILDYEKTASVTYSNIQGGWAGEGNIDADPCFVEPGYWDANDTPDDVNDDFWVEGDYYLLPDSLCIDAGNPDYLPEPDETDIDGNPRVIDGRIDMGAYETNYIQAAMKLTPQALNCNSKGKYVKAHLTLPEGFLPEDVDVNEPAIAEPMGAESEYIKVLGSKDGPVRLEIAFDRETFCDSVTETGEVEITVIGSLTTGQYFYATDTIKIKPRR